MDPAAAPGSLNAASPDRNATVHASAGTGKTWLLVTRIIRLLLAGASPDNILAVTFTRKAATEMQERLGERLGELMRADDDALDALLADCGIQPDQTVRQQARGLYERNLFNTYPLRTTTFHAFCQEILQRFPLEAGIPPGFEIIESTALLEQEAWDALFAEATLAPQGALAEALELLVERCNGLPNTRKALMSFLFHRSDWWAFTRGSTPAKTHAAARLSALFGISPADDPLAEFPDPGLRARLDEFATLLAGDGTATSLKHHAVLTDALATGSLPAETFEKIKTVLLTADGKPLARKGNKAQRKRMGEEQEQRYLALHALLANEMLGLQDKLAKLNTLQASMAWYTASVRLLAHYQRIKQEQRLLDFADIEWQACELLNRGEHASWVQYKLDNGIDHLLVDEFQDTNPTQWRLLLPLLEELAAGDGNRARSVFLVGDEKQSIYRFRRANPALLGTASDWLSRHLQAERYPLDKSRRSARAIIDCINAVFGDGILNERISHYHRHATYHEDLYGHVEVLPLAAEAPAAPAAPAGTALRNPLQQPRQLEEDQRHYLEGCAIAERIRALVDGGTPVGPVGAARRMVYGDIMILLRTRTHAGAYERALRDAGIPYLGANRGTLLMNVEIRDLEALLNILISPYDNLALAQVLRSPLFAVSNEELMRVAAAGSGTWYERLAAFSESESLGLATARRMLADWRELAGQIPVHDLLDRIYHEGELVNRYVAAYPAALVPRVRTNLTRFIELALELDSGRYPSLPRFLNQLERLRRFEQDPPDEGVPDDADSNRVSLMTIHGAKGLESPVVFLADTASPPAAGKAYEALIDWPAADDRPASFLLNAKKADQDSITRELLARLARDDLREEANLLYVAMTRARQFLFISGSRSRKKSEPGWYDIICDRLASWRDPDGAARLVHRTATLPAELAGPPAPAIPLTPLEPGLRQVIRVEPAFVQIAPSRTVAITSGKNGDADGLERGIAIHCMLDWLSHHGATAAEQLPATLAGRLGRAPEDPDLMAWRDEAMAVWSSPGLAGVFDRSRFEQAWNEVPVQYRENGRMVYGIIDRLVISGDAVQVIDYKTHGMATSATAAQLAAPYAEQIRLYARGAALLWPGRRIRAFLLFTACQALFEMDLPTS